MTDPIRQYIDTHIPENHRQGDGCYDAAQRAMGLQDEHHHGPLTWNGGRSEDGGGWKCDVCGAFPVKVGLPPADPRLIGSL